MRITESEARKLGLSAAPKAKAKGRRPTSGAMNKTESAYARHLEAGRAAGEILWWAFQPLSLRLANNTHYRPDFLVLPADLILELIDVKGRSGGKWAARSGLPFYAEEDSYVKIKIAASLYPFRIRIVWPKAGGGWDCREL